MSSCLWKMGRSKDLSKGTTAIISVPRTSVFSPSRGTMGLDHPRAGGGEWQDLETSPAC